MGYVKTMCKEKRVNRINFIKTIAICVLTIIIVILLLIVKSYYNIIICNNNVLENLVSEIESMKESESIRESISLIEIENTQKLLFTKENFNENMMASLLISPGNLNYLNETRDCSFSLYGWDGYALTNRFKNKYGSLGVLEKNTNIGFVERIIFKEINYEKRSAIFEVKFTYDINTHYDYNPFQTKIFRANIVVTDDKFIDDIILKIIENERLFDDRKMIFPKNIYTKNDKYNIDNLSNGEYNACLEDIRYSLYYGNNMISYINGKHNSSIDGYRFPSNSNYDMDSISEDNNKFLKCLIYKDDLYDKQEICNSQYGDVIVVKGEYLNIDRIQQIKDMNDQVNEVIIEATINNKKINFKMIESDADNFAIQFNNKGVLHRLSYIVDLPVSKECCFTYSLNNVLKREDNLKFIDDESKYIYNYFYKKDRIIEKTMEYDEMIAFFENAEFNDLYEEYTQITINNNMITNIRVDIIEENDRKYLDTELPF